MAIRQDENKKTPWSEEDLVQGIIVGDTEARAAFVRLCHDATYVFACRLCTDTTLRADWTHDCILRLLQDISDQSFSFRGPGSLWGWFRKRAWYLIMETRRSHHRRTAREFSDGGEAEIRLQAPSGPDQDLQASEISQAIVNCLDGISSPDHRRVLTLLVLRSLEYHEIAQEVDAPLNTVRAWIRRGRLNLRRCLAQRLELEWEE